MELALREYQKESVNTAIRFARKRKRVLVVSPTGSGKTVMAAEVVRRAKQKGILCRAISHRSEISSQLRKKLGCESMNVQSLLSSEEDLTDTGLLIIDEAHHYTAPEWSRVFEIFGDPMVIGYTATPCDGLGDYFDEMVVSAYHPDLVRAGHLSKVRLIRPKSFIGPDLFRDPVQLYLKYCKGERAFLFASTKDAAMFFCQKFADAGVKAAYLDAQTPEQERKGALKLFRDMHIDVICNIQILTEGVDVPEASCCILAGNSSSVQSYLQKTGRVLRPHETKEWATILDMTGSSWIYGSPIAKREFSLTTGIIPLDPLDSVRDCPQCAWAGGRVAICPKCGWDFYANQGKKKRARILNKALEEVWCGAETPKWAKDKEWTRLIFQVETSGRSIYWAGCSYKKLFSEPPPMTEEQKLSTYLVLVERAIKRKAKVGQAFYMYRDLMGRPPSGKWVNEVKREINRGKQEEISYEKELQEP